MMNKDEAVVKLSKSAGLSMSYAEDLYDSLFEKPVVPQYVADWYEGHKWNLNREIWEYLTNWDDGQWNDFKSWMFPCDSDSAITTLVTMHQFGYEVEKETKYTVTMKNVSYNGHPQFLCTGARETFWSCGAGFHKTKYTRKELESNGFGWVFDCEGIEIEEVE